MFYTQSGKSTSPNKKRDQLCVCVLIVDIYNVENYILYSSPISSVGNLKN